MMNPISVNPKLNNHQIALVSFKGEKERNDNNKNSHGAAGVAGLTTSGLVKGFPKVQPALPQFIKSVEHGVGARRATILTAAGKYCNNPLVKFGADIVAICSLFDIANGIKIKGEKAYNNVA